MNKVLLKVDMLSSKMLVTPHTVWSESMAFNDCSRSISMSENIHRPSSALAVQSVHYPPRQHKGIMAESTKSFLHTWGYGSWTMILFRVNFLYAIEKYNSFYYLLPAKIFFVNSRRKITERCVFELSILFVFSFG